MPAHAVDLESKQQGNTWLLPPYSYSLRQIASELDVGLGTVQKWRQELVDNGHQFENDKQSNSDYSADQKFAAVIATAVMSEHELAGYCREHGLFVEQVKSWKSLSIDVHKPSQDSQYKLDTARRADKKKIKSLEKELLRKDKALAETAVLLVLREKYNALWDNSEED
jgi:transposase-like protein|tara:strand:+ start:262 stop:765 length:504 start_codon:yes stop_codon:yes gene_type:complete